jgi:hypothetical protein
MESNSMSAESIEFGSANSIPSMSRNDQKSFDEDPNFFMWIRNDGLLRDEGILFGQAQDEPEPKIAVIRQYFKQRSDQLGLKIEEARTDLERLQIHKDNLESKLGLDSDVDGNRMPEMDKPFLPQVITLSIYLLIVLFNYPFLYYFIKPIHKDSAWIITTGIYLFGGLAVFQRNSLMFHANKDAGTEGEKPERWKLWLQEIGVPIVVVLFLFNTLLTAYPISSVISVCLFQLMFFGLVGKGIKREFQKISFARMENKAIAVRVEFEKKRTEDSNRVKENMRNEINEIEAKMERTRKLFSEIKQEFIMNEARAETCVKLFMSEFQLAKAARNLNQS